MCFDDLTRPTSTPNGATHGANRHRVLGAMDDERPSRALRLAQQWPLFGHDEAIVKWTAPRGIVVG